MQFSLLSIAALASVAAAEGINCNGSALCKSSGVAGNLLNLKAIVDNIPDRNRHYDTAKQIACTGSICAYFQKGASGTAARASELLGQLLDHGCKKCGSIPTEAGNDVNKGELTVNYVSHQDCQGAC
ncbi:hypothetical protein VHEMI00728 [[Torrubiella] hemipterigena]|uniref:Killer toxin Kp4 domain-containing protein n=1 Tax=[Torrubiella] hemipterigena TaxID=1531966 RepID=A0A0A1T2R8_9HYPO|nr:hypothetical protein VHEMI00728 [[Torrubiella] hemipterigena]